MNIQDFDKSELVAVVLGSLVDSMGGIAEIDVIALQKFIDEDFYAVKLEFKNGKVVLEVMHEDSIETSASQDPDSK